jgi:hypothetical protein
MGLNNKKLLAAALFLASAAHGLAGTCAGTVATYLVSSCDFGPATLQVTNFSDTFGISDDQMNVFIVNYGTPSNPFFFLDIQPQSGLFSGNGTASVQLQLTLPAAPVGLGYTMAFYVTNGCCEEGTLAFSDFPGGTMTESITATTTDTMFGSDCKPGDSSCSNEQITSGYESTWGTGSRTFDSYVSSPFFQFFEFSEPSLQAPETMSTPEPSSWILLPVPLLALFIAARRRFHAPIGSAVK